MVDLGFETSDDLAALAKRRGATGYADAMVAEDNGLVRVWGHQPDGQRLEIHPTA
jgi:hypothetical protein